MTSDEAVDVGLCYGWISGQRKGLDDVYYLQKYVPRRPHSRWSQVNVRKVAALTEAGRMRPSGITEVEAAKGRRTLGCCLRVAKGRDRPTRSGASPGRQPTSGSKPSTN